MLKTLKVPAELIALRQLQRASTREIGAPLYLPAFENRLLGAEAPRDAEAADREGDFAIVTIGGDEDDDFY